MHGLSSRFALAFSAALLLSLPCSASAADNPTTLASALPRLTPPKALTICVDAGKSPLARGHILAAHYDSVSDLAGDFGMIGTEYGGVEALAPAAMFQYNAEPADPNPFENMEANDIAPMLLASLGDAQWKALTGPSGLGLPDLATDAQRSLFLALFPRHQIKVAPNMAFSEAGFRKMLADAQKGISPDDGVTQDLTDHLPSVRLHLGVKAVLELPCDSGNPGHPRYVRSGDTAGPNGEARYHFVRPSPSPDEDRLFGIPVRTRVPNTLKEGEIDWSLPALSKDVSLADARTVDAVVSHIALATGLEIHADRLIGRRPVTVVGGNGVAPARDILRALALCVSGVYRKVGSAYVLTDGLAGRAVLRQKWVDIEGSVNVMATAATREASRRAAAHHGTEELSVLPGSLAPSESQRRDEAAGRQGEVHLYAFKDLTPLQQTAARAQADLLTDVNKALPMGTPLPLLPETQVQVQVSPSLEVEIPSLPGLTPIPEIDLYGFFHAGHKPAASDDTVTPARPKNISVPLPGNPTLSALIQLIPHKAVLAQPRTAAEVDALIASMKTAGLNELWLDVFSDGQDRTGDSATGILAEALKTGAASGVHVIPALDLWLWGKATEDAVRDRNMYHEDSADADSHRMRMYGGREGETEIGEPQPPVPSRVFVSPASPAVVSRLTALVTKLAATSGVDAMVWRETDPTGYRVRDGDNTATLDDMGYTEDMQWGFLRQSGMDPIDILPAQYAKIDRYLREGIDIPGGDDPGREWRKFREGVKYKALQDLMAAARANHPLTIFLRQDGYNQAGTGWYGSWTGTPSPLPTYHSPWHMPVDDLHDAVRAKRPLEAVEQAKAQSDVALYLVPPGSDFDGDMLAQDLKAHVIGKSWNGFVLDLRQDSVRFRNAPDYPTDPLAAFVLKAAR